MIRSSPRAATSAALLLCAWAQALVAGPAGASRDAPVVRHEIRAVLEPEGHRITVEDRIVLPGAPAGARDAEFFLHGGLRPVVRAGGAALSEEESDGFATRYTLRLPAGADEVTIAYGGTIDHPLEQIGEEYARGQMSTAGTVSPEGVYLSSSSLWYPWFADRRVSFTLDVELPEGWSAVSQGDREEAPAGASSQAVRWRVDLPQDDIYLVAAPYVEYLREEGPLRAMVFLREADEPLAARYLDATLQYVRMYSDLLGPYPYGKFALVENFWETGYGMPSFTLLGPKVLRFPFILHSSYPHEILHNWWGNGVFIDYAGGNWGEGLTAYLSDHLVKEQRGEGAEHRLTTLQKYADYVLAGRDLPLTDFRSRHGSVSEAVGYGKSMMLFHMLRLRLGDELFTEGLRDFFRNNIFRTAGFDDLRESFERTSGRDLRGFFDQWVRRPGAPRLRLEGVTVREGAEGFVLAGELRQVQGGEPFDVDVPLAVTVEGREEAEPFPVRLSGPSTTFEVKVPSRPLRVDVDPEFDVFRRLDPGETPPALSRAFGADDPLILLPEAAGEEGRRMYLSLAESLRRTGPGEAQVAVDTEYPELPPDRSVWILGWENRLFHLLPPLLEPYGADLGETTVRLGRSEVPRKGGSFVLTTPHPRSGDLALLWIGTDSAAAVPGLGRKLPHYHKYSYLAFEGDEPENVAKGRWPVTSSPLTVVLPGGAEGEAAPPRGSLPRRKPLAALKPVFSRERMMESVTVLAGAEMRGRGAGDAGLDRAADWIAARFRDAGLAPAGDGGSSYFQQWVHRSGDFPDGVTLRNVLGVLPGSRGEWKGQTVVVAAHYDHLGLGEGAGGTDMRRENAGKIHPGADDNASGVAVLLELARVMAGGAPPERTVVFAAFTGEEAGSLGARHYLAAGGGGEAGDCRAMVNIDTVGRLGTGKLLVLGGGSAREWVHIFRGAGYLSGVEVEMAAEGLDSSDQVCFQEAGIPAVQLFTGPHLDYHRPSDTADRVDAEGLVKVAALSREVVEYLAGRPEALSPGLAPAPSPGPGKGEGPGGRRTSLGTVPDFGYAGPGVRLAGVVPGSPAEGAGLAEGDVITAVDGTPLSSLRDLSSVLRRLEPGTTVRVTFSRSGGESTVEAVLRER